jgi:hypothetical protein
MVCLPKEEGGLGVLDLNAQNRSMLMKQLHKIFKKAIVPWIQLIWDHHFARGKLPFHGKAAKGSLWWRNLLKLLLSFKEVPVSGHCSNFCFLVQKIIQKLIN